MRRRRRFIDQQEKQTTSVLEALDFLQDKKQALGKDAVQKTTEEQTEITKESGE